VTFTVEYDAYRVDLEELNLGPRTPGSLPRLERAQRAFQSQRDQYHRTRDDLWVKVKLLEENRVRGGKERRQGKEGGVLQRRVFFSSI